MYRFLDRHVCSLDEPHRFLLAAMRSWVAAARVGRCPGNRLANGFADRDVGAALGDFTMAMALLDNDGLTRLGFRNQGCERVGDDEARLLVLFDAGLSGTPAALRRIAATLVTGDAERLLSLAVERVAMLLVDSIYVERDR